MSRRAIALTISLFLLSVFPAVAQRNEKQSKQQQRSRQAEESGKALKRILDEDLLYIITDEERAAFNRLQTDEERESFLENFWLRRDPYPDTPENEYKDEHYARIAYANDKFASGIPGWKTDRGRIYITFGPPDSIDESMPTGGTYYRPFDEGGGVTSVFPFEKWRYRYIEGIGQEVIFEFVDSSMSGEYRLAMTPSEKDALLHVPGAGLTEYEMLYGIDKAERWNRDYATLGPGLGAPTRRNQFDMLEQHVKAFTPPAVKFKDLETVVSTKLSFNLFPFKVRADFIKVTESQVLTPITVEIANKDFTFKEEGGIQRAFAEVYGEIRDLNGRFVRRFENLMTQDSPQSLFRQFLEGRSLYQTSVFLEPGRYKLDVVVKDRNSGNMGTFQRALIVPRYQETGLASSSLILASRIENVPSRVVGGPFILGDKKVMPNVREEYRRQDDLNVWWQIYGLKVDEATHKPSATIETLITRNGQEVRKIVEESADLSGAAQQMTITKTLPLAEFEPGNYAIQVRVTDNLTKDQQVSQGKFVVR